MQTCNVNELRNHMSEEEYNELFEDLKERVESIIEFSPEDYNKSLEQIEQERKKLVNKKMRELKVKIDINVFSKTINIEIEELDYKTCITLKPGIQKANSDTKLDNSSKIEEIQDKEPYNE